MGKEIFVVGAEDDQLKIEKFLKKLGISHLMTCQMMRKGNVRINGRRQRSSCIVQLGDTIEVFGVVQPKVEKNITFTKKHKEIAQQLIGDIIYKDENVLILNKPAGIAVQGGNKVKKKYLELYSYQLKMQCLQLCDMEIPLLIRNIDNGKRNICCRS